MVFLGAWQAPWAYLSRVIGMAPLCVFHGREQLDQPLDVGAILADRGESSDPPLNVLNFQVTSFLGQKGQIMNAEALPSTTVNVIHYVLDDEPQETTERVLTPTQILQNAKPTPLNDRAGFSCTVI
jgi:hypothetical protein